MEDDKAEVESCDRDDDVISINCSDDDLDSDSDESPRNKFSLEREIKQEQIDNYPDYSVITTLLPAHRSPASPPSPPPAPPTTHRPSPAPPAGQTQNPSGQSLGLAPVASTEGTAPGRTASCGRPAEGKQNGGKRASPTDDGEKENTWTQGGVATRVGSAAGSSSADADTRGGQNGPTGGRRQGATGSAPSNTVSPKKNGGRVQDKGRGANKRLQRRPVLGRSSFTPGRRNLSEMWKRRRGRIQVSVGEKTVTRQLQDAEARRLWERMQLLQEQNAELKNLVGNLHAKVDERVAHQQRLYEIESRQNCDQRGFGSWQPHLGESLPGLQAAPMNPNSHQAGFGPGQPPTTNQGGEALLGLQAAQGNHNSYQARYGVGQPHPRESLLGLQAAQINRHSLHGGYVAGQPHKSESLLGVQAAQMNHQVGYRDGQQQLREVVPDLQAAQRFQGYRNVVCDGRGLHLAEPTPKVPVADSLQYQEWSEYNQYGDRRVLDQHPQLNRGLRIAGHAPNPCAAPMQQTTRAQNQVRGATIRPGPSLLGDPERRRVVQERPFSHHPAQPAPVGGANRAWTNQGRGVPRGIQGQHRAHVGAPIAERVMKHFERGRRPPLRSRAVGLLEDPSPDLCRQPRCGERTNLQAETDVYGDSRDYILHPRGKIAPMQREGHGGQRQYSLHPETGDQRRPVLRAGQHRAVAQTEERVFPPSQEGEYDWYGGEVDRPSYVEGGYPGDCYGWEEGGWDSSCREPSRLVRQGERLPGQALCGRAWKQESLNYRDVRDVVHRRELYASDTRNVMVRDGYGYQGW